MRSDRRVIATFDNFSRYCRFIVEYNSLNAQAPILPVFTQKVDFPSGREFYQIFCLDPLFVDSALSRIDGVKLGDGTTGNTWLAETRGKGRIFDYKPRNLA